MNNEEFQRKLSELIAEIKHLPQSEKEKVRGLAKETQQRHDNMTESFFAIKQSVDYLRVCIKYMLFDLEATRRENGYLKAMLNDMEDGEDY